MDVIIKTIEVYEGDGWYWGLFALSLLYIFLRRRKEKTPVYFAVVSVATFLLIIVNPVVIKFLNVYMGFDDVYWRLYWLLPVLIVIAYAMTEIIKGQKGVKLSASLLAAFVIIIICGDCIYLTTNYELPENKYKLPQEAVVVSDMILECAKEEEIKAVVPAELSWSIRQYTGKIKLLYGRDGRPFKPGKKAYAIYEQMNTQNPDLKLITRYSKKKGYDFIVLRKDMEPGYVMEEYGYELIGETETYKVYQRNE